MTEEKEYVDEICEAVDIDYDNKIELAERVYNFIRNIENQKGDNQQVRMTSQQGFEDTSYYCQTIFIQIVNLVIGKVTK